MKRRTLVIDALVYKKNKAFGYQEYLFNLLDYFFLQSDKLNYNKIIIVCDRTQLEDFKKFENKFILKGLNASNVLFRIYHQHLLYLSFKLNKNDTILFTGNYSALFKSCNYILVIHDLLYLRKQLLPNFLMRFQRHLFVPRSVAISNIIITISEFTKKDILNNFKFVDSKKIFTIYNYFNFSKYDENSKTIEKSSESNYFLTISSQAFHKNTITVLKAFERYCNNEKESDLFVVGKLSIKEDLRFYERLPQDIKSRIKIFSNISNLELSHLYKGSKAYISASLFEGLGMPLVEAMYFNIPLIISNLEVFKEIADNKSFFFNPLDDLELYELMLKININKMNMLEYDINQFSAENTSERYIEILNNI